MCRIWGTYTIIYYVWAMRKKFLLAVIYGSLRRHSNSSKTRNINSFSTNWIFLSDETMMQPDLIFKLDKHNIVTSARSNPVQHDIMTIIWYMMKNTMNFISRFNFSPGWRNYPGNPGISWFNFSHIKMRASLLSTITTQINCWIFWIYFFLWIIL